MNDQINIFDVRLNNLTAKAAMEAAVESMQSESLTTIDIVTMDVLLKEQSHKEWKETTDKIDIVLPGDPEILEAADISDKKIIKDVSGKVFLRMFLRYLQRNKKKVFLLADNTHRLEKLKEILLSDNRKFLIAGSAAPDLEGSFDEGIINEINGAEPDCILSILSSPMQEEFIIRNRELLNTRMWLGCGTVLMENFGKRDDGRILRFLKTKRFKYQVERHSRSKTQE